VLLPLVSMFSGATLIGWAKPVPVNMRYLRDPRRDYIIVAAAGPASNLVLALFSALLLAIVPISPYTSGEPNVSVPVATVLRHLVSLNVLLAIFNMIPIPPLDGGNVLAGLLPSNLATVFNKIRPFGFLLLYVLVLSGGFETIVLPPYRFILSWLPTK
jgi:Zn-dependent protease